MSNILELNQEITERELLAQAQIARETAKIEALKAEKIARLEDMKNKAEADKQAAEELFNAARGADATTWLTADELHSATARQAFVLEDMAASASPDDFLNRVNQALKTNDKPALWLYHRHLEKRWSEYPAEEKGIGLQSEYMEIKRQLEAAIVPESVRSGAAKAREMMLEAEKRRSDAHYALYVENGRKGSYNPWG